MFLIILFFINIFHTPYSGKNRYCTTNEMAPIPHSMKDLLLEVIKGLPKREQKEILEEIQALCTTTIDKHTCDFTGYCPHASVDCSGGIYITKEDGFICGALLEELSKAGSEYEVLCCPLCNGHDGFTFQLESEHPLTLEEYRQLADEKLPYGDYSEKVVTFFKDYILTSFWCQQGEYWITPVYELLEELEE